MKLLFTLSLTLILFSCLKDVDPLTRNPELIQLEQTLEKFDDVDNWLQFYDTSKVTRPWNPITYDLTIVLEVTDPFILESGQQLTVFITELENGLSYTAKTYISEGRMFFGFTLQWAQFEVKNRCFKVGFRIPQSTKQFGNMEYCVTV